MPAMTDERRVALREKLRGSEQLPEHVFRHIRSLERKLAVAEAKIATAREALS